MSDDRLRLFVERIERINEEIVGLQEDRKDVYGEAKAVGYSPAIVRQLIARRAMKPEDRAEVDALLEAYEAAVGGLGPSPLRDPDETARELAIAILAEQIEGIGDPAQAALLAEHVSVLIDIRAEIAQLRTMENHRKTLAFIEGFDKGALTRVVRWIEKCAKHGADAMRAGEAVFMLYRGTVEGRGGAAPAPVKFDPATEKSFVSKAKSKAAAQTAQWLASGLGN